MNPPERGDLIWLNFSPHSGHEQAGRRPALVMSPRIYNRPTGLAIICPVTRHAKGYPFEVVLPAGLPVGGVVLCDHARSLDWRTRRGEFICSLTADVVDEVAARIVALISGEE